MKRRNIKLILLRAAILLAACGFAGCTFDEPYDPGKEAAEGDVGFEITVPGLGTPVTRSIEGGKGEASVKTIDLLIFDKSEKPVLLANYKIQDPSQSSEGPDYKVTFSLKLPAIENAGTVAAIANASSEVDSALLSAPVGSEKRALLEQLKFSTAADGGSYKWKAATGGNPDDYTPIPMYGEVAVSGISEGSKITGISLVRMVARIDIQNQVSGSVFKMTGVYLVNYNTAGYIAPAWNTANGKLLSEENAGYPYTNNLNPMIPNPAGKQPSTQAASMFYQYSQGMGAGPELAGEIYAYEAVKGTGDRMTDAVNTPCLIIKGIYEGREYFYRIDFSTDKGGSAPAGQVEYMPIYRNHKYIVRITAAEGIGYESFSDALISTTVLSNLKTTIMVVNTEGIKDIVFDGQYFMGVESREIPVVWGISKSWTQVVSTNFLGVWKAEVVNPAGTPWLRFTGGMTMIAGANLNGSGIGLEIDRLAAYQSGASGQILITAGRLRMTLTITRTSVADLFARSNVIQKDAGRLTFAVTAADNATIPAWSQGVYFKWGSLFALAPPGNPYAPATHVVYNPAPGIHNPAGWGGGLAGWDKIPYAHTIFGFPASSASNPDNKDEFKTYNGGTGYNKNAGIGDICRYISANTGWVEGDWRMPTYDEVKMLLEETAASAKSGDFKDRTATLNASAASYMYGTFNPMSGWFAGAEVTASTGNTAVPPQGTLYLPAAGHRYPNGDGDVVQVGAYGFYWTSTPYDTVTVNYPFLSKYGIEEYDADRSYAFPVRCIKDYQK